MGVFDQAKELLKKAKHHRATKRAGPPKNWKCPQCQEVKLGRRRWAGNICRSCYMRAKIVSIRYEINGYELRRLRDQAGLKQYQFAEECGWTSAYQSKLEASIKVEIGEQTLNVIRGVLKKHGVDSPLT